MTLRGYVIFQNKAGFWHNILGSIEDGVVFAHNISALDGTWEIKGRYEFYEGDYRDKALIERVEARTKELHRQALEHPDMWLYKMLEGEGKPYPRY